MWAPAAVLAGLLLARMAYPAFVERRQLRRRRLGSDGIVVGAAALEMSRRGGPAVLLLHGGGDTPQAFTGLAKHLYDIGFSVRAPLLSAHGRHLAMLRACSAREWFDDTRREYEALRTTHEWVGVVGLSMGGALAVKLAAESDVGALVLLAPYLAMPPFVRRLAVTAGSWGWAVPYFSTFGARSIRDPDAAGRALGHGILTPAALRALLDVVNAATEALPRVKAPTLVIQSREDNRITAESAERAFAALGSAQKRFVWTDGAGHVISVDFGYKRVFDLTADWLQANQPASPTAQRTGSRRTG
jgi:carboxylesterase